MPCTQAPFLVPVAGSFFGPAGPQNCCVFFNPTDGGLDLTQSRCKWSGSLYFLAARFATSFTERCWATPKQHRETRALVSGCSELHSATSWHGVARYFLELSNQVTPHRVYRAEFCLEPRTGQQLIQAQSTNLPPWWTQMLQHWTFPTPTT